MGRHSGLLRCIFDVRVLYGLAGILISIAAHEAVHVLFHAGEIESVSVLPDLYTLMAIDVSTVAGYSVITEESVAYTVTIAIIFLTIVDIYAIHDSRHDKHVRQILGLPQDDIDEYFRRYKVGIPKDSSTN